MMTLQSTSFQYYMTETPNTMNQSIFSNVSFTICKANNSTVYAKAQKEAQTKTDSVRIFVATVNNKSTTDK